MMRFVFQQPSGMHPDIVNIMTTTDTDGPPMLQREYERLGLSERHRKGCQLLAQRLDIATLMKNKIIDANGDMLSTNELSLNPVLCIRQILSMINPCDSERTQIQMLCQGISQMPVFHYRIRRDKEGVMSEFWSPLQETLDEFIEREPDIPLRLYHDPEPNPAQDVIFAVVHGIVTGE